MDSGEATEHQIRHILEQVRTALPGVIEAYDWKTRKATVKPTVKEVYADGKALSLPLIPNVPVVWPHGENCSLEMPLKRGSGVLLLFAARSLDDWLEGQGEEREPDDPRMHHLSDAIAVPGLYPWGVKSIAGPEGYDGKDVVLSYQQPMAAQRMEFRLSDDGTVSFRNEAGSFSMSPEGDAVWTVKSMTLTAEQVTWNVPTIAFNTGSFDIQE